MIKKNKLWQHVYKVDIEVINLGKNILKDYYGAIVDFNKAIKLETNDDDSYYNRGRSKHSLKDHSGAITDYTKAIELNPSSHSYNNRGDAKKELGDLDGACSDWRKATNLGHTNGKWVANQCN